LEQELVWKAYQENLELALPQVVRLLGELRGKSVVTSDHGNAFGEFGVFGHPGGVYTNSLVKVPWLVTESNSRPKIKGELADQVDQQIESQVTDRLKDLGYAN
jgi:bisphosphoglycerate-independent phosphoglycerate mutase (AlkP superfamily)